MPQRFPGKRLPVSVWGEPESCVKNDRNGAAQSEWKVPRTGSLVQTWLFVGDVQGSVQLPKPTFATVLGKPIMRLHDGLRLGA